MAVANSLSACSSKHIYGRNISLPSLGKVLKPVKVLLDQKQHQGRRGFLKLWLGNVGLAATGNAYADDQGVSSSRMSYSRFLEYLDKDRVTKVDLYENGTIAIVEAVSPELGNRLQRVRVQLPGLSQELLQKFREKNIDFAAHNGQEDSGSVFANLDFMEVVEFLKKPERFTAVGARIPKGVLLIGPPGTGKTLLAKAIAGEAGVPFFSISGSEFVEMQRGTGIGGGNDEREQTLNQLLTEMDGFEGNTGVIVVAATNRPDILDSALLRPGRFDRQVSVDVPDVRGRTEILKVHAGNKKFEGDVSLEVIAMRTPGFSGADLANLLNEAAILAGRRGRTAISSKEIDDSIDRIVAGMEGTVMTDGKSKSLVAYHEVGHAISWEVSVVHVWFDVIDLIENDYQIMYCKKNSYSCMGLKLDNPSFCNQTLTPGHDAVQKVTLIPRGQARGLTWFIPTDDPTLISKQQLFARIVGGLGGRAAEEVIFGEPEVTTGAVGDLQQITGLAKQMVTTFGMSDIGPWNLMDSSAQSGDMIMRMMARNSMSEKLAEDIDAAVKRLTDSAYEIALSHIKNNQSRQWTRSWTFSSKRKL
ncbi:hypothetical protein IFM89_028413 [Coptis chinensis]|uniref:AAA+ ATPase domain-containing protein n=1 Tax=Coptis chinensis TaxID=261450 RepID=A0A835IQ22_9MAGN|nr:hypothetical protein IFM89_028413 [Coptis chinensis]